jgi:hypothetical protein
MLRLDDCGANLGGKKSPPGAPQMWCEFGKKKPTRCTANAVHGWAIVGENKSRNTGIISVDAIKVQRIHFTSRNTALTIPGCN